MLLFLQKEISLKFIKSDVAQNLIFELVQYSCELFQVKVFSDAPLPSALAELLAKINKVKDNSNNL